MPKLSLLQVKQAIENLDFLIANSDIAPDLVLFSDQVVSKNRLFSTTTTQQNELKLGS